MSTSASTPTGTRPLPPSHPDAILPVTTYHLWTDGGMVIHDYGTYADVERYTASSAFCADQLAAMFEHLNWDLAKARTMQGFVVEYRTISLEKRGLRWWRNTMHSFPSKPRCRAEFIECAVDYGYGDETNRYPLHSVDFVSRLPEDPAEPKILGTVNLNADDPTSIDWISTLTVIRCPSFDRLTRYVLNNYAPYHCHHEYDCCGRWYRHFAPDIKVLDEDAGLYAVIDSLYRNV